MVLRYSDKRPCTHLEGGKSDLIGAQKSIEDDKSLLMQSSDQVVAPPVVRREPSSQNRAKQRRLCAKFRSQLTDPISKYKQQSLEKVFVCSVGERLNNR